MALWLQGAPVMFHGFTSLPEFSIPSYSSIYLGFTARTGGATNNHWVRSISRETVWTAPPPPLPAP